MMVHIFYQSDKLVGRQDNNVPHDHRAPRPPTRMDVQRHKLEHNDMFAWNQAEIHLHAAMESRNEEVRRLKLQRQLRAQQATRPARAAQIRTFVSTALIAVAERVQPATETPTAVSVEPTR